MWRLYRCDKQFWHSRLGFALRRRGCVQSKKIGPVRPWWYFAGHPEDASQRVNRQRIPAIAAALLTAMAFSTCAIATGHAAAKKKQPSDAQVEIPDITSDYIFGFTSPTGLGNAGDLGFSNESDGRVRKRDGSYSAYNAKFELGYTISQPWWVAASVFASRYRITNVTDLSTLR